MLSIGNFTGAVGNEGGVRSLTEDATLNKGTVPSITLRGNPSPSPMPHDGITRQIDDATKNEAGTPLFKVVFIGFSGLGYQNVEAVKEHAKDIIDNAMRVHPDGLAVVIGGTSEGIGFIYDLIKDNASYANVKTVGIVSEVVKEKCPDSLSGACDTVIFVPDKKGTWEVLNKNETHSYTAYAAENHGELIALGGGAVGKKEIEYAVNQGVSPTIMDFRADPSKLESKVKQGKSLEELMPMQKFWHGSI